MFSMKGSKYTPVVIPAHILKMNHSLGKAFRMVFIYKKKTSKASKTKKFLVFE